MPKHAEHARTLFVMAYEQAHPGAEKLVEQLDKEVAEASAKQQEEPADEPESIGKLSRQSSDTQLRDSGLEESEYHHQQADDSLLPSGDDFEEEDLVDAGCCVSRQKKKKQKQLSDDELEVRGSGDRSVNGVYRELDMDDDHPNGPRKIYALIDRQNEASGGKVNARLCYCHYHRVWVITKRQKVGIRTHECLLTHFTSPYTQGRPSIHIRAGPWGQVDRGPIRS